VRRFLLSVTPEADRPELAPADARHALRVLRLEPGDRLVGLDGRGRAWPLRVVAAGRAGLELASDGPPRAEPEPGAPGSGLPWIELALPLPRGARAEGMLERLVQLGLARLTPLVTERTAPHASERSATRIERLERVAAEAMKQCGRLWACELAPQETLDAWLGRAGARRIVLCAPDPGAAPLARVLSDLPGGRWTRTEPLCVLIGPEGGLTPAEQAAARAAGARPARLAAHTLRTETAAEAALAIAVHATLSD